MVTLVIAILAIWLLSIVGFAIRRLLWLAFIGVSLSAATAIIGFIRRSVERRSWPSW